MFLKKKLIKKASIKQYLLTYCKQIKARDFVFSLTLTFFIIFVMIVILCCSPPLSPHSFIPQLQLQTLHSTPPQAADQQHCSQTNSLFLSLYSQTINLNGLTFCDDLIYECQEEECKQLQSNINGNFCQVLRFIKDMLILETDNLYQMIYTEFNKRNK